MRRLPAAVAALALVVTGCSSAVVGTGTRSGPPATSAAGSPYGAAPQANPAVTYQPDVVIVGGGAGAIHGVANGGLTWYLDPNAPNAHNLAVGKVLFVTGRAVGRVIDVHSDGGDLAVTIAPVTLTDVIEDGHFSGAHPISLSSPAAYESGAVPFWAAGGSPAQPQPTPSGTHSLTGAFATAPSWPTPKLGGSSTISAQGITATASCCKSGASLHFGFDNAGVRFAGTVTLTMAKPSAIFDLDIDGGKVTYAKLMVTGGLGLKVEIAAATKVFHNVDKLIPIPTDFVIPFANLLGVPLSATINQLLSVHTFFSSKDGNISASGEWGISGGLGFTYDHGKFSADAPHALQKKASITDSLEGISTGVTGIAIAYKTRLTVGIGAFGFTAGPYFGFAVAVSLARGSALGAPITVCNSAQVTLFADYGVGYSIPKPVAELVNFFLEKFGSRPIEATGGISQSIQPFSAIAYDPDTKICRSQK